MASKTSLTTADGSGGSTAWVKLVSQDNFNFVVPKEWMAASGMLRNALDDDGDFTEAQTGVIQIHQRGIIVSKIVEYLAYTWQYRDTATKDIPEDFTDRIEPELALELLMAADYMEV